MALITNATTAWSAPITLVSDEIWQTRRGGVFLTTTASPVAEDGLLLREGIGMRVPAGTVIYEIADSADGKVSLIDFNGNLRKTVLAG